MQYLTTMTADFGPLAWVFFVLQIILAVAGGYAGFVQRDSHPVRHALLQRLGYVLLSAGAIGILLGALRLGGVDPFTARYWFYIVAVIEVALAAFVAYYSRTTYPQQMAAASRTSRRVPAGRVSVPKMPSRPTSQAMIRAANRPSTPAVENRGDRSVLVEEPSSINKRRDARRDRKRRKR